MKQKYVRVNKCERCGGVAGHFIWTTSAQVNAGIYTMYPKGKICFTCMKELQTVYPNKVLGKDTAEKRSPCPMCGGTRFIREYKTTVNPPANGRPDTLPKAEKGFRPPSELYCEKCGWVVE